jgi:hypothetical protein
MFVEGEVEVTIKDPMLSSTDDYDLKLWLQRAFKANSCYRILKLKHGPGKLIRAVVAINTRVLPESEWKRLEADPPDALLMAQFIERTFSGEGVCVVVGKPSMKTS